MSALRGYQTETITTLETGPGLGFFLQVVQLPTGTGKTHVIAERAKRHFYSSTGRSRRVMITVERDDLVSQTLDKLRGAFGADWDRLKTGIIKAARNDVGADIVIGSIQTLARMPRLKQVPPDHFGLIIVDECHLRPGQYAKILDYFGCFSPEGLPRCLADGFTATLMQGTRVPVQLSRIWQRIAFERSTLWAIGAGYLVDPKGFAVELPGVDLEGIGRSGDDFDQGELGDAMSTDVTAEAIVRAWSAKAQKADSSYRRTVAFQPTRASAKILRDVWADSTDLEIGYVDGDTGRAERDAMYAAHRAGEVPVIVNVGVLTTGWDSPETECAIISPTRSKIKFRQCAGRVLRPAPWAGKEDALLLLTGYTPEMTLAGMGTLADTFLKVEDGESLKEAVERAANGSRNGKLLLDELHLSEISLFGQAQVQWLRTPAGVRFVPLEQHVVFLFPEHLSNPLVTGVWDRTYTVGVAWTGPGPAQRAVKKHSGVSLEHAFELGEDVALELEDAAVRRNGMSIARRGASWRRRLASEALKEHARKWGINTTVASGDLPWRAGELSDRIAIVKTGKMLDHLLPH